MSSGAGPDDGLLPLCLPPGEFRVSWTPFNHQTSPEQVKPAAAALTVSNKLWVKSPNLHLKTSTFQIFRWRRNKRSEPKISRFNKRGKVFVFSLSVNTTSSIHPSIQMTNLPSIYSPINPTNYLSIHLTEQPSVIPKKSTHHPSIHPTDKPANGPLFYPLN